MELDKNAVDAAYIAYGNNINHLKDPVGHYLAWSNKHNAFWAPNGRDFVTRIEDAGRFSKGRALEICLGEFQAKQDARPNCALFESGQP